RRQRYRVGYQVDHSERAVPKELGHAVSVWRQQRLEAASRLKSGRIRSAQSNGATAMPGRCGICQPLSCSLAAPPADSTCEHFGWRRSVHITCGKSSIPATGEGVEI